MTQLDMAVSAEANARIERGESLTRRSVRKLLRKRIAVACLAVIALFYVVGAFAPLIAPYGYASQNLDLSFNGPSLHHPLGTDRNGRDSLSRNIYAARTTVIVTVATVATGFVLLPVTLGMLAGYRRGFVDAAINRTGEILGSMPGLPMLVLINVTMRPRFDRWLVHVEDGIHYHGLTSSGFADYFLIFFVLSLFGWVSGARLIRAQVLTLRESEFILAAEASGASTGRILWQHILPNIMPIVIVGASAGLGGIAGTEIALTFLGVGIQPPHPSFGALITDAAPRTVLQNHPQLLLVPATIVASLIFAFNLLGDALNDVFTSRAR
ncbi:MAG: ABC transporter permease [Chloroflexota bacterium]|nr:ABC transporter permease [Chloroflexota bacterium]